MSKVVRSKGLSLRWRAVALFVAVGLGPAAIVGGSLVGVNRDAVMVAERQRQVAVASELSGEALREIVSAMDDTRAMAAAISLAAAKPGDQADALAGVRSLLASRRSISAIRFEVPAAGVNTLIRTEGRSDIEVPSSTPQLRKEADERGLAYQMLADGIGAIVVLVPPVKEGGSPGYVTSVTDLSKLSSIVADLAGSHFDDSRVSLVVVDGSRRVIAAHNAADQQPGADASGLAVWKMLPEGTTWTERVGIVGSVEVDGEPSVANVMTIPTLGWIVAVWRPESVAYSALTSMQRNVAIASALGLLLTIGAGLIAARTVTRPVLHIAQQAKSIGRRRWEEVNIEVDRSDELGQLAASIGQMASDLEAGEAEIARQAKLRGDLSRFLSRELVEAIVAGKHPLSLGGRRAEVTVLFADVVAFTPLAESRDAQQVVGLLNELFSMLSEIVFRHDGMVDKYIGDCIMAVWGAAQEQQAHAEKAVAAAEDMLRFLESAADDWRESHDVEVRLGIGINSGEAIVGNIGSRKRMEFTVIGDVVNVAARLESIARPNQVLMAEATRARIGDAFETNELGEQNLTGRKEKTRVFELSSVE